MRRSIILLVCLCAGSIRSENLLKNGSFDQGLSGWQTGGAAAQEISCVPLGDMPGKHAVQIDTRRLSGGERTVLSGAVPVKPSQTYEVGGMVKRLAGYGYRSCIAVVWKDARNQMISVDNIWFGVLFGTNWVPETRRVISPAGAVSVQIKAGIETGLGERNAAIFTDISFKKSSPAGPDLSVELVAEKTVPGKPSSMRIHLTNTGDQLLSGLSVSAVLPGGMSAETAQWNFDQLAASEVLDRTTVVTGYPENSQDSIRVTVTAETGGKKVEFGAATRVNLADSKPVEVSSVVLSCPELPEMKVKLGTYYFPVMIDWGGTAGRPGLRAIKSMEPLLGYYNERSPEVADWHIAWARQHGISWFSVDWYWNQGEEFLNEALDEGLLKSRFADQMQFCIHWCNQDPACTTFRTYDYSPETMREMTTTLCDRYFSRSNYLTVDGKPVLMIFQPVSLINDNDGAAGAKSVLHGMEEVARSRGFKGIYFIAVNNSPVVPDYASAGFDAVAPYSFMFANLLPERTDRHTFDYRQVVQRYISYFKQNQKQVHAQGLKYIPTAWAGWDDIARYGEHRRAQSAVTAGNTPAVFRSMAQALPEYVEKENPLALVEAWNEWGEGTVIEPSKAYGFDHLSALLNVLSVHPPAAYPVPVPDQESFRRMQANPSYISNISYAEKLTSNRPWASGVDMQFENKRSLWLRAAGDGNYTWIEGGQLHAFLKGAGAQLIGPEAVWLDTAKVRGIDICLKPAVDTEFALQWRMAADAPWTALPTQKITAEKQVAIRFDCSGNRGWTGEVYQFRFVFKESPEQVDVDWVRTF